MFSSTTSEIPQADSFESICNLAPTSLSIASFAISVFNTIDPPAKFFGSSLPSNKSASVTVGFSPPLPKHAGPGSDPALFGPTLI